jgi:hypothetical protein
MMARSIGVYALQEVLTMGTCEIRFPGYDARREVGWIRWELFLHRHVRDVLPTTHPDTVCVVYDGDAEPVAWATTLRLAGFPTPIFAATVDREVHDAPSDAAA